jgi:hypothetical protein
MPLGRAGHAYVLMDKSRHRCLLFYSRGVERPYLSKRGAIVAILLGWM